MIQKDRGDFEVVLGDGEVQGSGAGFQVVDVDVGVMCNQQLDKVGAADPYGVV